MRFAIELLSVSSIMFIFMHEFDAFYRGEWKMFIFLKAFSKETQYKIFLYAHIPLTLFLLYYFWTIINFSNVTLWLIMNIIAVAHLVLHFFAFRWKSNVFTSGTSFILMIAWAACGIANLCLWNYY